MAIPDSNNFSLLDVVNEINPTSNDLYECFHDSNIDYFADQYTPNLFSPRATDKTGYELYYFRNYGIHNAPTVEVAPTSYTTDFNSDSFQLTIETTEDWTITTESWITPSQTNGQGFQTISISISENTNAYDRSGDINVSIDGAFATCTVSQGYDDGGSGGGGDNGGGSEPT